MDLHWPSEGGNKKLLHIPRLAPVTLQKGQNFL